MTDPVGDPEKTSSAVYDIESNDPLGRLVDRAGLGHAEIQQINALMAALARLRDAEQRLAEASLRYMKLNQTDMRALHYLIAAQNRHSIATPGALAAHLGISTASTTKLLDRLERAGHITRAPHPHDRRALAISIVPETYEVALNTVGTQQAKRFNAAARLSANERATVTRFLDDMTHEISVSDAEWANSDASDEHDAAQEG